MELDEHNNPNTRYVSGPFCFCRDDFYYCAGEAAGLAAAPLAAFSRAEMRLL